MKDYWELAPGLSSERLQIIAGLLAEVRQEVVATHEPDKGDTSWVLGCRAYGRTCSAIKLAAQRYDWLEVIDETLHFVFTVGGVPIRFAHGDHDEPRPHLLRRDSNEAYAQQLAFTEFDHELIGWRWRLMVETDTETLGVTGVVLIQASGDGQVENFWRLELTTAVPAQYRKPEPRELPPPSVELKGTRRETPAG